MRTLSVFTTKSGLNYQNNYDSQQGKNPDETVFQFLFLFPLLCTFKTCTAINASMQSCEHINTAQFIAFLAQYVWDTNFRTVTVWRTSVGHIIVFISTKEHSKQSKFQVSLRAWVEL